jgi:hypothetical protein
MCSGRVCRSCGSMRSRVRTCCGCVRSCLGSIAIGIPTSELAQSLSGPEPVHAISPSRVFHGAASFLGERADVRHPRHNPALRGLHRGCWLRHHHPGHRRVLPHGCRAPLRAMSKGDPDMAIVSDLVGATINKPVAAAARFARRALERSAPEARAEGEAPAAPRKSKGGRRHVRQMKARQHGGRG